MITAWFDHLNCEYSLNDEMKMMKMMKLIRLNWRKKISK